VRRKAHPVVVYAAVAGELQPIARVSAVVVHVQAVVVVQVVAD